MATKTFLIKVPLTSEEPAATFVRDLPVILPRMLQNYGQYMRPASAATNVPMAVLMGIAMVESTGSHTKADGVTVHVTGAERSTGLMQVSPATTYDAIRLELKKDRIAPAAMAIFKKYIPSLFTGSQLVPYNKAISDKIQQALTKIEFNVWAGATYLRRMMELHADDAGNVRLDRVVVRYNMGEYSSFTKSPTFTTGDTATIVKALNPITSSYILKLVGKNGAVPYIIKNKLA